MLFSEDLAAGAVLVAANPSTLPAGYPAICFSHSLFSSDAALIITQLVCFATGKLTAANALVDTLLLATLSFINDWCAGLFFCY